MEEIDDTVDRFLKNQLSETERLDFLKKLEDPQIQKMVEDRRIVYEAMELKVEDNLKAQFLSWDTQDKEDVKGTHKYGKYWIFATVVAAAMIVFFSILKQTSDIKPQQVAENYAVSPADNKVRSSEIKIIESDEEKNYNKTILEANDLIKAKDFLGARKLLQDMPDYNQIVTENKEWMLALTHYLENGRQDKTFKKTLNEILFNPKHNCYNLAVRMDEEVNSFWGRMKN